MSMLVRAAPLRVAARSMAVRQQVRGVHFENTVDNFIPVKNLTNKYTMALKLFVYAGAGFGLPFYAVHFHQAKAAGA